MSPVAGLVENDVALTSASLSLLGMLPPLGFAAGAFLTPLLVPRLGLDGTTVSVLLVIAFGLAGRAASSDAATLIASSAVAFAAVGVLNVLLPALVKRHFPARVGSVTTLYVTLMGVGTFLPPLVAMPIAQVWGWRAALLLWALLAAVGVIPWLLVMCGTGWARPDRATLMRERMPRARARRLARSPIVWGVGALCAAPGFIAYSMFAWYPMILVDTASATPVSAGAMLALYAAMGAPAGMLLPALVARWPVAGWFIALGGALFVAGFSGMLLAPVDGAWTWALLGGAGQLLFPLSLVLLNIRTRTAAGAVWLGSVTQGGAYVFAATGPLVVGLLHDTTGSWTVPLIVLLAVAVAGALVGLLAAPSRFLENDDARVTRRDHA